MQYFKNRYFKIIFITFLLLLIPIIAIFVYSPTSNEKLKSDNPWSDISIRDKPEDYYDNFSVDKISIVKRENDRVLFSLSADKVVHRKRISRLFVYQNLKEIYMSGVKIDFYPYDNASIIKHKNIAIPIIDIGSSFKSLGKPSTAMEDYLAGRADIDLDLLTRILLEDLSINIYLPASKKISITAKVAHISTDFENFVLGGPVNPVGIHSNWVKIVSSNGKELYSSEAVWSRKFNGLYLPNGYTFRNEQRKGKAFFAINTEGEFSEVPQVPEIEYTDSIEEKEKVLYAHLSRKIPPYLRFMFGMTGEY